MTTAEWEAYGDASASHQTVTIDGVTYTALAHVSAMPHHVTTEPAQGKD